MELNNGVMDNKTNSIPGTSLEDLAKKLFGETSDGVRLDIKNIVSLDLSQLPERYKKQATLLSLLQRDLKERSIH